MFASDTPSRSDAQVKARLGNLQALTSGLIAVPVVLAGGNPTNVLTVSNPDKSGKVVYVASLAVQATSTATVYRLRNASLAGSLTTLSPLLAGIVGSAVKTSGTAVVTQGNLEAVTMAGQPDPAIPGTIRLMPGESLTWAVSISVAGSAAVSLQVWSEPTS